MAEESLVGEVAMVVFANPDNGFAVIQLAGTDEHRASGPLAGLVVGQPVRLIGGWVDHDRYGPTFVASSYDVELPQTDDGLVAFLSSERFRGVGPERAKALVDHFGVELGQIVTSAPERLAEARGVSLQMAQRIAAAYADAGALPDLVRRLSAAGLPAAVAVAVHRRFGERALGLLDADPYRLLVVRGVGWAQVSKLAAAAGIDKLDPRRLAAGALAAHREATTRGGHVALPEDALEAAATRLLRVAPGDVRKGIDRAAARRDLVSDVPPGEDATPLWYTPADLASERGLADELARLSKANSRVREQDIDPLLTAEQAQAVRAALGRPISVMTGGPGTGKTRTVCDIVRLCAEADLRLALCAPTGRAAKRLEEVTGHGASTIHRLLDARPTQNGEGGFKFAYDADRRLPHDVVVADEWSMADLRLAWALAQAVDDGSHLILVGDADQLPSVGTGAVLRDLLDPEVAGPDGPVAATRLTHVHRQAAASRIVTLAHEINGGQVAPLRGRDGDVFVVAERSARIAERVAEIVAVRAPEFFGLPPSAVQVLAPMYRGAAGVDALNAAVKERVNPAAGRRAVAGFHEADRVVQTRNDAELEVANGDIGEVVATNARTRTLEVAFPQGVVSYRGDQLGDLRPAWALTVHKAQGGEWPVVVLVLDAAHRVMLWRELVYTAVTRAATGLLLVGDAGLLAAAARRTGSGTRERVTRLAPRLVAASTAQA